MANKEQPRPRTPATEAFCGAVGGTAGAFVAFPIDTVKTRLQAAGPDARLGGVIRQLFKTEGIRGFYRGVQVMLGSQGLYIGAAIGGMQLGRAIYDTVLEPHTNGSKMQGESFSRLCFSGTVAGICCGTIATPGERLRVLLQTQAHASTARGALPMIHHVYMNGGAAAFFTGLPVTIAREIPGMIVWIGSYDLCFRQVSDMGFSRQSAVLVSSVVAPIFWTVSAFPQERLKVLQQAVGAKNENLVKTILRMYAKQGLAGFGVGFSALTCRNILIDVVQLPSVDVIRCLLGIA